MKQKNQIRGVRLLLFLLILFSVIFREGRILGLDPFEHKDTLTITPFTSEDVKTIFPTYTRLEEIDVSVYTVFDQDKRLGTLLNSSPKSDSIIGYVNAVPLLVGLDTAQTIVGIQLLPNLESHDFMGSEIDQMVNRWKGWRSQSPVPQPDGVSGATFSSNAVQRTIHHTVSSFLQQADTYAPPFSWEKTARTIASILVLMLALLMYWKPARLRKYRNWLLLLNVAIIGFWLGDTLSIHSIYRWLTDGIHFKERWLMVILFFGAIALPLFTKRAFYCTYVCPFGAAQELTAKLNKKRKIKLSPQLYAVLGNVRELLFGGLMLLLCIGIVFDLTNIEPFAAFVYQSASLPVLILALSFLTLSLFINKPWCHFFCPTGEFLEIIRKLFIIKEPKSNE